MRRFRKDTIIETAKHMLLLKNGSVLGFGDNFDILISDGKITKIQRNISFLGCKTFDCRDKIITPGLIDLHTHIRSFKENERETIESGIEAAISGGFTTICIMPNTDPPIDNPKILGKIKEKQSKIQVFPIGAIAKEMGQLRLSDIKGMKDSGIFAISDDGAELEDKSLLKDAMDIASELDLLVILHCEIPSEPKAIEKNISLCLDTKSRLHIAHISTKDGISLVKQAKKESQCITCEATPHHFTLSDVAFNVKPPIRTKEDKEAVIEGLCSGTIDIIVTDHAPHPMAFDKPGISGIEICLSLVLTELVNKGYLSLIDAIGKLAKNPSKIIGLQRETKEGCEAYLTIIDLKNEWVVKKEDFKSKGKNTPFEGWKLKGRPISVITPYFDLLF
ncbi:MAG: dihydroorotase [bacterium]